MKIGRSAKFISAFIHPGSGDSSNWKNKPH